MKLLTKKELHLKRKLVHILVGGLILCPPLIKLIDLHLQGQIVLCIGIFGLLIESIRLHQPQFNEWIFKYVAPYARAEEKNKIATVTFYFIGCGLVMTFTKPYISVLCVLYLVFADPIAAIMGNLHGKMTLWRGKTLIGSFSFFLVCLTINFIIWGSFIYSPMQSKVLLFIFFSALIGMLSELFAIIDDNISIPLLSGLGITLIDFWLKMP